MLVRVQPDGRDMNSTSRYAALPDASLQEEQEGGEAYELATVRSQSSRLKEQKKVVVPVSQLVMPARYHKALDSFLKGTAGDSDSDSDTMSDGAGSNDEQRHDSLELLLNQKTSKEEHEDQHDIEGQPPAWMRKTSTAENNNVLRHRLALPTIIIIVLVVLAAFFAGHKTLQSTSESRYKGAKKLLTLGESLYGTYWAETKSINWLAEAGDGVYSYKLEDNSIMLHDLTANTTTRLVEGSKILNDYGIRLEYSTFQVSPDLRYILFSVDRDPVWRWSSRSNYWIHDLEHSTTVPLIPITSPPSTAIAKWSPKGHNIAFVQNNDLYISTLASSSSNGTVIRITRNGNETIFNGVPDWVYEEEVFSSDSTTWWSPDGKKLAFLSFDESEVHVYSFPVYNPKERHPGGDSYPTSMDMRYPKPGTTNPKVTLHLFDFSAYESGAPVSSSTFTLEVESPLDVHDRVITEVVWVGNSDLIIKETNRAATRERVAHFYFSTLTSEGLQLGVITRDEDYTKTDGGWAETGQRIHGMTGLAGDAHGEVVDDDDLPEGYLDIIPDSEGYMHLALFSPANAKEPVFLTSGKWEIDGVIKSVDLKKRIIYFIAANPSIERHLYSVKLPTKAELEKYKNGKLDKAEVVVITDSTSPGFYDASFSPNAGYYLLGQKNGIPWQKVEKVDDPTFNFPISDNAALKQKLSEYSIPKMTFMTANVNNVSINVAAILPPNMDMTGRTKYPMLLRPYGGPNSQTVQNRYKIDWSHYLASEGYVILEIDGRGTGYKGRTFRSCIRGNLGELEADDQIKVAEWYRDTNPFVDEKRIGIQGWSYGGYLTAKVIETNSSSISLGMSVAPVTDWRYYDTIYTERYMGTLEDNKVGYDKTAVNNMEGFKHADYLLLHGSGDDNVHYLNSASLLDKLTFAKVRGFRFRMFTDSAHSMSIRGAYEEVFNEMTRFLFEKFGERDRRNSGLRPSSIEALLEKE